MYIHISLFYCRLVNLVNNRRNDGPFCQYVWSTLLIWFVAVNGTYYIYMFFFKLSIHIRFNSLLSIFCQLAETMKHASQIPSLEPLFCICFSYGSCFFIAINIFYVFCLPCVLFPSWFPLSSVGNAC